MISARYPVVNILMYTNMLAVAAKGYGYFEDRRPASNADPYRITNAIMVSCCGDAE